MEKDIKVSVLCFVYNHEKFLRKCLESLVNQKSNFKYEIVIHDDASTDDSRKIIEEFYEKYPDKIVMLLEKENQYSKGKTVDAEITFPKAKGKYIAFCEGDDCWCDNLKLQKQFDYMEKNPEASMCVHNTIIHDLLNEKKDQLFNNWSEPKELTDEDVFFGWKVHTTSYFIRKKFGELPDFSLKYWFGDFVRLTMAYHYGKILYLPDIMSIYNYNNSNGLVYEIRTKNNIEKIKQRKKYLLEYNEYTNRKYETIVNKKIDEIDFTVLMLEQICNYKEFKNKSKQIKNNKYYNEYRKSLNLKRKIIFKLKYSCYFSFLLIKLLKKLKER